MGGVGWVRGGHPSDQAPPGDSRPRATRSRARQRACSGKEPRNNKHVGPPPHNPSFSVLRERKKISTGSGGPHHPSRLGWHRPRRPCPQTAAAGATDGRPPAARGRAAQTRRPLVPPARPPPRRRWFGLCSSRPLERVRGVGTDLIRRGRGGLAHTGARAEWRGGGEHADRNPTTRGSGGVGWARPAAGTGEKNLGVRGASVGRAAATGTTLAVRDRGAPCRRPLVFPVICFQPR